MSAPEKQIPDILLEQYALGELPEVEMRRIQEQIDSNPDIQRRLSELETSDREVLDTYDPKSMIAAIERRAVTRNSPPVGSSPWPRISPSSLRFPWIPSLAGLAAVVLLVFLVARPGTDRPDLGWNPPGGTDDGGRAKGTADLLIYRDRGPDSEDLLHDGDTVQAGDVLQLSYKSDGAVYGTIVSIDGSGVATLHFPARVSQSTRLDGDDTLLDHAYQLDNAPNYERFFFVTSETEFSARSVLEAARSLASNPELAEAGTLHLPVNLKQVSKKLHKKEIR